MRQLGKYRIDGVLGSGAMGVVYRAYDSHIARVVALKTIRAELLAEPLRGEVVARFQNEARACGRLSHPNIVAVYDYGEMADAAYIAMEFVDGKALGAELAPGASMAPEDVLHCFTQLLGALDYAHARGVVHRDIKPANLLLTADGRLKITDFGIARIESSNLTQTGALIGTPSYMAPEQFRGDCVDGRSDIFAAAVVLYQLLTGARPFTGSSAQVMHQILHQTPPDPSACKPELGTRFDRPLRRALAKRPAERYPTAGDFLAALGAAVDEDRTIIALTGAPRPAPDAIRDIGATPVQLDIMAELQAALSLHIGPLAKLLLKQAAAQALDLDDLCARLLPHIPSAAAQTQFIDAAMALRQQHGLSTLSGAADAAGGAPLALDQATLDWAEQKLTAYIGPIAKILVKRAAKTAGGRPAFFHMLAANLGSEQERLRFLREVGAET